MKNNYISLELNQSIMKSDPERAYHKFGNPLLTSVNGISILSIVM